MFGVWEIKRLARWHPQNLLGPGVPTELVKVVVTVVVVVRDHERFDVCPTAPQPTGSPSRTQGWYHQSARRIDLGDLSRRSGAIHSNLRLQRRRIACCCVGGGSASFAISGSWEPGGEGPVLLVGFDPPEDSRCVDAGLQGCNSPVVFVAIVPAICPGGRRAIPTIGDVRRG